MALALSATFVSAQDTTIEIQSPILIIDQDRLFAETQLGSGALSELEAEAEALTAENQRLESELVQQEKELTDQRSTLPSEEFRALADAFDKRVQQIRVEQDEKARNLNRAREEARQAFFGDVAGIISDIVRDRGAVVVLDRRDVFLSADLIDITDEAIEKINSSKAPAQEN